MADTVQVGSSLVIDGRVWTVQSFDGPLCRSTATVETDGVEKVHAITCSTSELQPMGGGLFALPGRIEKRLPREGEIGVAVATAKGPA